MSSAETPTCSGCGHVLDRIDHYGIEHLILDSDTYRPVNAFEGLASETDLRCGYCDASLPREDREYFYRRWYQILQLSRPSS